MLTRFLCRLKLIKSNWISFRYNLWWMLFQIQQKFETDFFNKMFKNNFINIRYMPYDMKFNNNFYNLMRSTRISIEKRIYWFSQLDNVGQRLRKILFFCTFLRLWLLLSARLNRQTRLSIIIIVDCIRLYKLMLNFIS